MEKTNEKTNNVIDDGGIDVTKKNGTLLVGAETADKSGRRNEQQFYGSAFPQLPILGYGVVNTVGGTTAVFDELAASPFMQINHQPDYVQGTVPWAVSRTGAGAYTLTHNFGHKRYLPIIFIIDANGAAGQDINVVACGTTTISIESRASNGGALTDVDAFGYIIYGLPL